MARKPVPFVERKAMRCDMAKRVRAGDSYAIVAALYNVAENTVRRACKEFATPKRRGAK